jgi:hypothetical protein
MSYPSDADRSEDEELPEAARFRSSPRQLHAVGVEMTARRHRLRRPKSRRRIFKVTKEDLPVVAKTPNDAAFILAEAVRAACIKAALLAYDDAGTSGLCPAGRWECALAAIRHLDLRALSASVDE